MSRFVRLLLPAIVLLSCRPVGASLQSDVDLLIRSAQLEGATMSVFVADADTESPLVAINEGYPMIPASNMKLVTTGAALHVLGGDFSFRTRLVLDEQNRLVVVADGDPAFGDPTLLETTSVGGEEGLDIESFLDIWVRAAEGLDVGTITELIIDDRVFDRDYFHEGWPLDQLNQPYCAEVAGMNFHQNTLHFYAAPAERRPSLARVFPEAPWLTVDNQASCLSGSKHSNTMWIARPRTANRFTVRGNVRFEYERPVRVTVHDPPSFFAQVLRDRMERAGVIVQQARLARETDPPFDGVSIGPEITTPLSTVVARCNTDSQNMYAEALLKRIAAARTRQPGSWLTGAAIIRHTFHERGITKVNQMVIHDGSGLSRQNRLTTELLVRWLNSFHHDDQLGDTFINSLAEAGVSGTMERRMMNIDLHDTRVHAKTGYINRVSCLSGYVTASDGRRRSFAIMINDLKSPVSEAKALQDRIVGAIAADLARTPSRLGSD